MPLASSTRPVRSTRAAYTDRVWCVFAFRPSAHATAQPEPFRATSGSSCAFAPAEIGKRPRCTIPSADTTAPYTSPPPGCCSVQTTSHLEPFQAALGHLWPVGEMETSIRGPTAVPPGRYRRAKMPDSRSVGRSCHTTRYSPFPEATSWHSWATGCREAATEDPIGAPSLSSRRVRPIARADLGPRIQLAYAVPAGQLTSDASLSNTSARPASDRPPTDAGAPSADTFVPYTSTSPSR